MTRREIQSSDVTWEYEERITPGGAIHTLAGTCGGLWSADYMVVGHREVRERAPEIELRERVLSALRRKDDATRH